MLHVFLFRFCKKETSCDQEDFFPGNCFITINNQTCPIPVSDIIPIIVKFSTFCPLLSLSSLSLSLSLSRSPLFPSLYPTLPLPLSPSLSPKGYNPNFSMRPEYKRNGKPINITTYVHTSPAIVNTLCLTWNRDIIHSQVSQTITISITIHCNSVLSLL